MIRLLTILACLMALATPVWAQKSQSIEYYDVSVHTARTVTSDGSVIPVDRSNTVSFDVLVSAGTANVTFRVSGAGAYGWVPLYCTASDSTSPVTETAASGLFTCNVAGANTVSARLDTCTGCTVSVVARRSTAVLGSSIGGGGGATPGLTAVLAVDRIDGDAVSQATALKVGSAAATAYVVTYYDSLTGLVHTCEIGGVLDDCHKGTVLLAGKFWRLTKGSVVEWEIDSDGNLTEGQIDAETAGVTVTIPEEVWWDVAACQNATPQLIWDEPTANAPAAACDTGANTQKGYASFDATTDESFETNWVLPTGFTGAIDIHFIWKAAATSGAVGWCAQLIRVADGSTSDPAYPAQAAGNCVSDTAKGTTLQENHATITGVTCTSCVARDHVYVRISRDANGGAVTDDMAGDAHLMKFGRTWRVAK